MKFVFPKSGFLAAAGLCALSLVGTPAHSLKAGVQDGAAFDDAFAAPVSAPAPAPVEAQSSVYVEPQDRALLFEGMAPPDSDVVANPFEQDLKLALARYRETWGGLPTLAISPGPDLREGSVGARVSLVRQRLGLAGGTIFDAAMSAKVRAFRDAHGLSGAAIVDGAMVAALNRGPRHYIAVLERNLRHASDLPDFLGDRYVHVDLANQRLSMVDWTGEIDSMAVVVGKANDQTPAMAGLLRHAVLEPYWNVPPDLVRARYARRIINGGRGYLSRTGFEAMDGYGADARVIPASSVNWRAVERGDIDVRLRQKPGPGNGMGNVKFMFPNSLGIYLHDTPSKHLFAKSSRLFSAGCVRVERPMDLGRWLFNGEMPVATNGPEEIARLPFPVPVYLTYFTAVPDIKDGGLKIAFRDDVYSLDAPKIARAGL